jgi:hypothetical protein
MAATRTMEIYADTRGVATCGGQHCGKRILWAVLVKSGKKMCFSDPELVALRTRRDRDGRLIEEVEFAENHWATCPDARKFESEKPKGATYGKTHQCYVSYCDKRIPELYLMCPPHWAKVSPATMREVWKWYRAKTAGTDGAESKHWAAIEQARKEVEAKESGPMFSHDSEL